MPITKKHSHPVHQSTVPTCAKCRWAPRGVLEAVDIVASRTGLHKHRTLIVTAVFIPINRAKVSLHYSIRHTGIGTIHPPGIIGAAVVFWNTAVWHLCIVPIEKETVPVPKTPRGCAVIQAVRPVCEPVVDRSPGVIQHSVVLTGVQTLNGSIGSLEALLAGVALPPAAEYTCMYRWMGL